MHLKLQPGYGIRLGISVCPNNFFPLKEEDLLRNEIETLDHTSQQGFTLLEVVMSLSIILILSITSASIMNSSFELRAALSKQGKINHRLSVAMNKISVDLHHVFILDVKDPNYNPERKTKAQFKLRVTGLSGFSELSMTTMNHESLLANSNEGDQTWVVYRVSGKDEAGRVHLLRGETKVIPQNLEEEIPMQILARNIKSFKLQPWNGTDWERDRWDTEKSDWRGKLPKMVKVEIETYEEDAEEVEEDYGEGPSSWLRSEIFLPRSFGSKEPKEPSTNIIWDKI